MEPIVRREIRSRSAPTFGNAWLWAAWGGLAALIAVGAVVAFVETMRGYWLAIATGALVFWWVLGERKQVHDDQLFVETIEEPAIKNEPVDDTPRIQPWIQTGTAHQGETRMGRFNFTAKEWAALGTVFITQDKTLSRDNVAPLKLFTNITHNWPVWIEKEFFRMGWFDETTRKANAAGREWFLQFLPHPNTNGAAVVIQRPTTTTTDDNDGGQS